MTRFEALVERYPELTPCLPDVQRAFELLRDCFKRGGKLLVCGNGGSAADSEHIVGELMKGYFSKRPLNAATRKKLSDAFPVNGSYLADHLQGALPAISLVSQISLLTAFSNDVAPDMIFAQQVYGYGQPGDVVLGISTSGSSANVLHALQVARAMGIHGLGLTGDCGGVMREICDVAICVPARRTPEVQEYHVVIYHCLCAMLEDAFFPE